MSGPNMSKLDGAQVLQAALNDENHTIRLNSLVPEAFDRIDATYPTTSSEVYTYKFSGATVATVTVTYVDATKAQVSSVVRS